MLPPEAKVTSGQILLDGVDLVPLPDQRDLNRIRGPKMSMIFQEPMSALNPVMRVGRADRRGPARAPGLQPGQGRGAGASS